MLEDVLAEGNVRKHLRTDRARLVLTSQLCGGLWHYSMLLVRLARPYFAYKAFRKLTVPAELLVIHLVQDNPGIYL